MSFNHKLIHKALLTATKYHTGQIRKNEAKTPYITHPITVALIAQSYTDNVNVICAALLHDTIEDTDYTFDQLREDFGAEITSIVAGVTEVEFANRKNTNWHERKNYYKAQLVEGPVESAIVSAADRTHNMSDLITMYEELGEKTWERFGSTTKEERIQFYIEVAEILKEKLGDHKILIEHDRLLEECKKL